MDYIALGCMSGTSLDGIDLSLIRSDGETYSEEIMNYFHPYSKELKNNLHQVIQRGYLTDPKIASQLSIEYSRTIQQFIDSNKKYEVNVIGIHGQTLFHDDKTKISIQLFDKKLNLNNSIPVICNFRKNDLLNGGFGAPIIPIYHQLIHQKLNNKNSVFVNIGGVTNITIINQEGIFAGDTSFGNALVNDLIKKKFNFEMDEDGYISSQGLVNESIIDLILSDPFFSRTLPKTLDRNYFHKYLEQLQAMDKTENIINSLLEIIPLSIEKLIFDTDPTIILCGGGRKNLTLQKLFRQHFKDVHSIDEYGLDGDYIESQGMALLSIRFLNKKKSTFTSTTGIKREVYLGERC